MAVITTDAEVTSETRQGTVRPDDRSARSLFSESIEHTKGYLAAEKEAITLRVRLTATVAKTAAIFGAVAAILALFGIGWLLVAVVGALAHLVGYIWAALIVGLTLLIVAFLCVQRVSSAVKSLPEMNG